MEPKLARARTADGVSVAYAVTGSGPTLIHLPGVPLSNLTAEWRIPVLQRAYLSLASKLRFVQYDGRGSGYSQRDVDDLSLEAMVHDLDAVIDSIGGGRLTLLGFYFSCSAAIVYATRHPERVSGLVLFGGAVRGWDLLSASGTQALISLIERDWDTFAESTAHAWYGWPDPVTGGLGAASFREATTPAVARATMREASRTDVSAEVTRVRCPALVLHRTGAQVVPLAVSEALAAALPKGRLELIDGSSANLFAEHPDGIASRIIAFVTNPTAPVPRERRGEAKPARSGELSPREAQVLRHIAAGKSNTEIAALLQLSVNTVERHITNLYRKIDVGSRAEAAAYAIRRGFA